MNNLLLKSIFPNERVGIFLQLQDIRAEMWCTLQWCDWDRRLDTRWLFDDYIGLLAGELNE